MLSRIADSLFWMNRYMERADGMLRSIKACYILSLDKNTDDLQNWLPVLEIFTAADQQQMQLLANDTDAVLQQLIVDMRNANSLKSILIKARENARGIQDHITKEMWEQVNQMYHMVNHAALPQRLQSYGTLEVIDNLMRYSLLYTGVVDNTMARGMGWHFMNLGKYIERCLQTIEITENQYQMMDYRLKHNRDIMQWRYLLLSLGGYELHLKRYRTANYNQNVLHQAVINQDFPRSILYSLSRLDKHLCDVVQENPSAENKALARSFGRLYSHVKYIELDSLDEATLKTFFATVRSELLEFSARLGQCFFSYA
ncbi:putative alpha-E superfamily protein [Filimonas zeae]|uniref:DUF403 domain-containing protein n=1 Tax=Filimonas zeae TaxID=1737353 RepID=A0A917MXV3_9BACT|nr:alpha-E domain-containing protein [Filimonas zeae]MDR6341538.1 putative alpha-E superfamily protein [Filimonas zeae]GGH75383.1 hypothetical protein GCM10011379_38900 [Filimonas zeae]